MPVGGIVDLDWVYDPHGMNKGMKLLINELIKKWWINGLVNDWNENICLLCEWIGRSR